MIQVQKDKELKLNEGKNRFLIFLILTAFLYSPSTFAQSGNVTNKDNVYIAANTIVSIPDSMSNNVEGSMINEGHIYIKGDWTNIGVFASDSGKVSFWGSSIQKIKGSANTSFYDCEINNASGVTLQQKIYVDGTLSLTSGLLTTGTYEAYVYNSSINAINPFGSSSYVVGNLRREVLGTGSYDFPLGTATYYELANLNLSSATGFSDILGSFTNAIPNPTPLTPGLNANGKPLKDMLDYGYWTLTPNVSMTGGTYTVTLNEKGASNQVSDPTVYAVIKRPNSSSAWVSIGTHSDLTQAVNGNVVTAVRSALSSFSDFGIAFNSFLLPIQLLSFDATADKDKRVVNLDWITASEVNNDFFTVERSSDAVNFSFVMNVKGAGTTTHMNEYRKVDEHPLPGKSYYRLTQTDFDGSFRYSQIDEVEMPNSSIAVTPLPNPATADNLNLNITGAANNPATVRVLDALGRVCYEKNITPNSNNYTLKINAPANLAAGYYMVEVGCNGSTYSKKVVLQ